MFKTKNPVTPLTLIGHVPPECNRITSETQMEKGKLRFFARSWCTNLSRVLNKIKMLVIPMQQVSTLDSEGLFKPHRGLSFRGGKSTLRMYKVHSLISSATYHPILPSASPASLSTSPHGCYAG